MPRLENASQDYAEHWVSNISYFVNPQKETGRDVNKNLSIG